MPIVDTPLRYPGGKSQLAPLVIDIMRQNDLFYGEYAEPFAGGAGIACKLLLKSFVTHIYINDFDPAVHAFWYSVINHTDDLCELIDRVEITTEEWRRQKTLQDAKRTRLLALGFSTFFLNRTNRSGIIRGGIIGGHSQEGNYKLDCRFNKPDLISKIQRLGAHRKQISLSQLDVMEFLVQVVPRMPQRALVNLDPPYYVKGPGLYRNFFTEADHTALAMAVEDVQPYWLVTYDNTQETRNLYAQYPLFGNDLNYSAQEKRVGTELLVLDPRLVMPREWLGHAQERRAA
jgi:DNA adenine methylase